MNNLEIKKYIFSGHDSFQCRDLWLKKGFDFIKNGHSFSDTDAVVKLGVGKNMVSSIKFWLKAFNIIDLNDQLTDFSVRLFDDENGYDPFLEDEASLWLLHYQLIKNRYASTYTILFNDFRKEKMFFSKKYLLIILEESGTTRLVQITMKTQSIETLEYLQTSIKATIKTNH